jgi:cobalamin-dependent methionine synthase I
MELHDAALDVGGVVAERLDGAHACIVGIATIGAGVEEAARDMKESGFLHSFALEALGAVAIDAAMEEFFRHVDSVHSESGEYVGVPFSPGETEGWNIEDQRTIYEILGEELYDVRITDSCLLIPKNSVSFLVGIYNHRVKEEGDSHCNYCSMRDKCLYKSERP